MPLGLLTAPAKMEGQEAAAAAAAEHDAAVLVEASKLTCDHEDEAVFAAITYRSPSMQSRSTIKAIAAYFASSTAQAAAAAESTDVVMG